MQDTKDDYQIKALDIAEPKIQNIFDSISKIQIENELITIKKINDTSRGFILKADQANDLYQEFLSGEVRYLLCMNGSICYGFLKFYLAPEFFKRHPKTFFENSTTIKDGLQIDFIYLDQIAVRRNFLRQRIATTLLKKFLETWQPSPYFFVGSAVVQEPETNEASDAFFKFNGFHLHPLRLVTHVFKGYPKIISNFYLKKCS